MMTKDGHPVLDIEVMQRLYEFGGLLVYRVVYFDPVRLEVVTSFNSFNEDVALKEITRLQTYGFTAGMESFIVKFDGAFKEDQSPDREK